MNQEQILDLIGHPGADISPYDNLFSLGFLDSFSVLELLERISVESGVPVLELAEDLEMVSTLSKILSLTKGEGGD